jgi:hypothetical protein
MSIAFREADRVLLSPGGWMGTGERGVGGSKCGSTAAVACIFQVRPPLVAGPLFLPHIFLVCSSDMASLKQESLCTCCIPLRCFTCLHACALAVSAGSMEVRPVAPLVFGQLGTLARYLAHLTLLSTWVRTCAKPWKRCLGGCQRMPWPQSALWCAPCKAFHACYLPSCAGRSVAHRCPFGVFTPPVCLDLCWGWRANKLQAGA